MRNKKRVAVIIDSPEIESIVTILRDSPKHGSIGNAFRIALEHMMTPQMLARKDVKMLTKHFLSDEMRERIIAGENINAIAYDIEQNITGTNEVDRMRKKPPFKQKSLVTQAREKVESEDEAESDKAHTDSKPNTNSKTDTDKSTVNPATKPAAKKVTTEKKVSGNEETPKPKEKPEKKFTDSSGGAFGEPL